MYDPDKFRDFERMIEESTAKGFKAVLVHHPQVLGDTYEELTVNLDKLAAAGLLLQIVPPAERDEPKLDPRRN